LYDTIKKKIMKSKILLFSLFMVLTSAIFGQTFLWESFDAGQMPPTGWSINGLPAQWSIGNSNNAGGVIPEGKFSYTDANTSTRLISPMIDLTGLTSVKFSFKFFYDYYGNPAPKIGIATRSHIGAWTSVWEITPTSNVGPLQIDTTISNGDVGQTDFQVCMYLNGNMFNLDYVYVDNFLLYKPLNRDGALVSLVTTPYYSYFADPLPVKGSIINTGLITINSVDIQWQLDGGAVHNSTFSGLSLSTQQMYDFTCADLLVAGIGLHNLKVWIAKINGSSDEYLPNDTLTKPLNRVCNTVPKKPLFEEFTSSTCSPCESFNSDFVPWCNTNENNITLIKYQMNWPSPGDIYYTAEGGVRRDFYGVGGVPDLYCNGGAVVTEIPDVNVAYTQGLAQIGIVDLAATHTLTGHVIDITATVLPFADFPNCKLYIVVMEKVTHNNVGSNGETSFEHVMMKMIPDASGISMNLTDRVPFTFTQSVDLTGTHVEEWNDLIVGIFVQDQGIKMIYQSAYSLENGVLGTEARLASIMNDGTLLAGFSSDTYDYDVVLPSGTVTAPEITATPIDPKSVVIIVPAGELPGTTAIDVFAEDLITHTLYTVNFTVGGVGMDQEKVKNVVVYPNPTKGMVYLMNADHSVLTLTTVGGEVVRKINDFTGTSMNLNSLAKGVYILSIQKPDGTMIRKKIVLL
jgi:hypothetical protein